eukprot:TRINITY_DN571_c0_g1_i1.p1 TRINITY_DN571_c0_g1~~TRINITY_DN571_c0_g1_i1.p1  ORF type:complete len:254 (-),score=79.23 TRINITY_DN571_c0_g1_i1:319-1080(-)
MFALSSDSDEEENESTSSSNVSSVPIFGLSNVGTITMGEEDENESDDNDSDDEDISSNILILNNKNAVGRYSTGEEDESYISDDIELEDEDNTFKREKIIKENEGNISIGGLSLSLPNRNSSSSLSGSGVIMYQEQLPSKLIQEETEYGKFNNSGRYSLKSSSSSFIENDASSYQLEIRRQNIDFRKDLAGKLMTNFMIVKNNLHHCEPNIQNSISLVDNISSDIKSINQDLKILNETLQQFESFPLSILDKN